jgi:hypothetical protein
MSENAEEIGKKGLRTSYISTVIGISLVLFMIGLVLGGVFGLQSVQKQAKESLQGDIFFKSEMNDADIKQVELQLKSWKEFKDVYFVSPERAIKEFGGENQNEQEMLAIFSGDNPENLGKTVDVTKFYRQIPKGTGHWMRDYVKGTVVFTDSIGKITTGTFVSAGTEDLGNGKTMTITNNAFAYNLSGTDDWTNIYKDYDKFVKNPRRYWISVTKH